MRCVRDTRGIRQRPTSPGFDFVAESWFVPFEVTGEREESRLTQSTIQIYPSTATFTRASLFSISFISLLSRSYGRLSRLQLAE